MTKQIVLFGFVKPFDIILYFKCEAIFPAADVTPFLF